MLSNIHLTHKQTAHHHPQGLGLLEQELRASGPALRILKVGSSLASRRSQPAEQRGKASSGTRKTAKRDTNRGDSSKRATEGDQNLWGAHRVDKGGCSAQTALPLAQCAWILVHFLRGTLFCPRIWSKLEGPETSVPRSGAKTRNSETLIFLPVGHTQTKPHA